MDAEERRRLIAEKQALIRERAAEAALRELKSVRFIGYAETATEGRADEKLAEIIRYEGAPAPWSASPLRSAGERIETIASLIDNFRRGRLCLVPSRNGSPLKLRDLPAARPPNLQRSSRSTISPPSSTGAY